MAKANHELARAKGLWRSLKDEQLDLLGGVVPRAALAERAVTWVALIGKRWLGEPFFQGPELDGGVHDVGGQAEQA